MILISNFYGSVHRFLGHWVQTKYFIYNIKRLHYRNGVYVKELPKPFFTAINSVTVLRYGNGVYVKGPLRLRHGYVTVTVYIIPILKCDRFSEMPELGTQLS
jgi:hypothetical protein